MSKSVHLLPKIILAFDTSSITNIHHLVLLPLLILLLCKTKGFNIMCLCTPNTFQWSFSHSTQHIETPMQPSLPLCVTAKVEIQMHTDLCFRKMLSDFNKQRLIELSPTRTSENF